MWRGGCGIGDVVYLSLAADRNAFSVFGFTANRFFWAQETPKGGLVSPPAACFFFFTAFPRLGGLPGQSVSLSFSLSLSLAAAAARPPAFACRLPAAACRPLPPPPQKRSGTFPDLGQVSPDLPRARAGQIGVGACQGRLLIVWVAPELGASCSVAIG